MPKKKPRKPITEELRTFPAGRGKIAFFGIKRRPRKPRSFKKPQPHFMHVKVASNPDNITIAEYLDTSQDYNVKHVYLFPEARELSRDEREDLALSLLATVPNYKQLTVKRKSMKFPVFLTHRQRAILRRKYRRYDKWRRRNQ